MPVDQLRPTVQGLMGRAKDDLAELVAFKSVADPKQFPPREPANRPAGRVWRPPSREHLPGSTWLPNVGYGELSAEFELYFRDNLARLTENDPSRPLVFYCEADCWMSWNAAKRALAYGYDMVIWYPEGTEGWRAAGLPLEAAEPVTMPDFLPIPASAAVKGRAE